jgi:YVTN family beta-propeller protein
MVPRARWFVAILVLPALLIALSASRQAESAHTAPILATSISIDPVDPFGSPPNRGSPLAVNPATNRVYVVNEALDKVSVIDGVTNAIVDTIATSQPRSIAVAPTLGRIYVTNRTGTVSVFDANDHSSMGTIPVGILPSDIAVNETLDRVYAVNEGSGTVSVIDGGTSTVVADLSVGADPGALAVNPITNTVYVARRLAASLVKIIDVGTSQFTVGSITGLPPFNGIEDVDVNPVTNTIYVAESSNTGPLVAIDGGTEAVATVGPYYHHVTVNPDAGILYTTTEASVFLLDAVTHAVVGSVAAPAGDEQMVANSSTYILYVLESSGNLPDYVHVYDDDTDTDGVADVVDNCPDDANANQNDLDSDGVGDVCDPDVDGDGTANEYDPDDDNDGAYDDEGMCGADEFDPTKQPERIDGAFAGSDEDGDGQTDEALPPGAEAYDCDGDGYSGTAEAHVYSYLPQADGDQKTCQEYDLSHPNPNADIKPSLRWPADFNMASGVLDSFNRINILDVTTFMAPVRYLGTDVGTNPGDVRWDLVPGKGLFTTDINIQDLTALIAGPTGYPPMLGGARAFGGPACPWPP